MRYALFFLLGSCLTSELASPVKSASPVFIAWTSERDGQSVSTYLDESGNTLAQVDSILVAGPATVFTVRRKQTQIPALDCADIDDEASDWDYDTDLGSADKPRFSYAQIKSPKSPIPTTTIGGTVKIRDKGKKVTYISAEPLTSVETEFFFLLRETTISCATAPADKFHVISIELQTRQQTKRTYEADGPLYLYSGPHWTRTGRQLGHRYRLEDLRWCSDCERTQPGEKLETPHAIPRRLLRTLRWQWSSSCESHTQRCYGGVSRVPTKLIPPHIRPHRSRPAWDGAVVR